MKAPQLNWLNVDGISYIPSSVLLAGIPKVTLKDNKLFVILDTKGDSPRIYQAELGFYFNDTRYICHWDMKINGHALVYLSHEQYAHGSSCIFSMTNRDMPFVEKSGRVPRDMLHVRRILTLYKDTVFENVQITNYDTSPYEIEVSQMAECDFEDIFEVRGLKREKRGNLGVPVLEKSKDGLPRAVIDYKGLDGINRLTFIQSVSGDPSFEIYDRMVQIKHRVLIGPKERKELKTVFSFDQQSDLLLCGEPFKSLSAVEHVKKLDELTDRAFLQNIKIHSDNMLFDRTIENARIDIEMLTTVDGQHGLVYPYAGIPWFSAPFGRDGMITAYQTLPWYPDLAIGVLDYAFRTQGKKFDPFTDEEPGKIFHEMRYGEMAKLKEIPYIPYYGSVDSTPLSLILLGEYVKWTGDLEKLRGWWPGALKALEWMDRWGDPNGDGFLEYERKRDTGLFNQGWKDSHNSVMHSDGRLADPPISLAEVQAYSYRARCIMSNLAARLGESDLAHRLAQESIQLQKFFRKKFWDEAERYVYLALDGQAQPCQVMSSNQGHCLWGKILDPQDAETVSRHLMSARLFSGYGIRTLAADELAYNPLSYHNGSIWPHDNSLIAEGFRYYNQLRHLQTLADGLFDVARYSIDFRLPELFCGFRRRNTEPPIPYEVACKPQAWAAGSIFLLLKSLLGINLDDKHNLVLKNPLLPSKVKNLEIDFLRVRGVEYSFRVSRREGETSVELRKTG